MAVFGYARISRKQQSIERQIRNIQDYDRDAIIFEEAYTGTKMNRPQWNKLYRQVRSGDTLVFDSVSRMSRNAEEGYATYEDLASRGVNLVFLKEPQINTETYNKVQQAVPLTGTNLDLILDGINKYMAVLKKEQIRLAFDQAQKEVDDLHQRTKEGLQTARINGKQIGRKEGDTFITKKSIEAKKAIHKHHKLFGGSLNDTECIQLLKITRNTYYKYKRELLLEMETE